MYPFTRLSQSHAALAQVAAYDISASNNNDTRPHVLQEKKEVCLISKGKQGPHSLIIVSHYGLYRLPRTSLSKLLVFGLLGEGD